MRILVVDDELSIHEIIKEYSTLYGHECTAVSGGMAAIKKVQEEDFDVIIMDVMMPDLDGFVTTKRIKQIKEIPVIMLSARHSEDDKLYGFKMGVDDYMTKPFSAKELMARINVITLRSSQNITPTHFQFENLVVDTLGRFIEVNEKRVNLKPKEYELLLFLINRPNQVCTRDMILQHVWSDDYIGDDRTVDSHIKMLRQSLGNARSHIKTIRGMGYMFETNR